MKKKNRYLRSDVNNLHTELCSLELYRVFIQTNEEPANPPILLLRLRRKIDYDYDESFMWWINQPKVKIERFTNFTSECMAWDEVPEWHAEEDNQTIDSLVERKMNILD